MTALVRGKPVQLCRLGTFYDPRWGEFHITEQMFAEMVMNFNARTFGQDIHIDRHHNPQEGSAGVITRLWVEGDRLMADVNWSAWGLILISERGFRYLSIEFDERFRHNETLQDHGCLLKGAGLCIRPVVKNLEKVELSEFQRFRARLAQVNPLPSVADALAGLWVDTLEANPLPAPDRAALEGHLLALAEACPDNQPRIELAEVERLLAQRDSAKAAQAQDAARRFAEKQRIYKKILSSHPSWLGHLTDEERGAFAGGLLLIDHNTSDAWVKELAAQQVRAIDTIAISRQLSALGWQGPMPAARGNGFWDD